MGLRVWRQDRGGQECSLGRGDRQEAFLELRVSRGRTTVIFYQAPTTCQALF